MKGRWYEHWLRTAASAERSGNILGRGGAYFALEKAAKHTFDPDELKYLRLWQERLKKSAK